MKVVVYMQKFDNFEFNFELPVFRVPVALRPCPFCGGSAEVVALQRGVPDFGDVYGCVCLSCFSVGKPFDNPFDSAEFWNTRTSV